MVGLFYCRYINNTSQFSNKFLIFGKQSLKKTHLWITLPLGHYLDIILEKTGFSPCFKQFREQKQDITQSSFHCRVMSLFNFKYLCD